MDLDIQGSFTQKPDEYLMSQIPLFDSQNVIPETSKAGSKD